MTDKEALTMQAELQAELEATKSVLEALAPLSTEQARRVLRWIGERLPGSAANLPNDINEIGLSVSAPSSLADSSLHPKRVASWLRQNEISEHAVETVFHIKDGEVEIIAADIPGKSKREKTLNAYVLVGLGAFILKGEGRFSDDAAREVCHVFHCFDGGNHAKYVSDKGNLFSGSKERGWDLTAPGLSYAAGLLKEMSGF